jgi:hypothetical protein
MIELTLEQSEKLNGATPVVVDPQTNRTYVLVPQAVFERLRCILDDDEDVLATGELVDRIMAADDANDAHLQSYQSYERKDAK